MKVEQEQNIIDDICKMLSQGESLRAVFRDNNIGITRKRFYELLEDNEGYQNQYARACEDRSDYIFEEILEIADEKNADVYIDDGEAKIDGNTVQRSKLKVDTRKWMLGKMNPKKYGEKIELGGSLDQNIKISFK